MNMGKSYNHETYGGDHMDALAVNIDDGMKVILYLTKSDICNIVEQLYKNGQLEEVTAKAIASTVASAVKRLHNENWMELRSTPHKPSNLNYDFEEDDDPRTVFAYGDGDE